MDHIRAGELPFLCKHIPEFFSEFLVHARHALSLSSFAKSYKSRDQKNTDLISFSMPIAHQMQQRQSLSVLINSGKITESLNILNGISGFLSSCPDILFDIKCQHFIELAREYFEHPRPQCLLPFVELSPLLCAAQSIADVYCFYKLSSEKKAILRSLFSLFLYIERLSRSELPYELEKLLKEENRSALSESILKRLVLYSGEKLFSNLEMAVRHTAILLEELYSHTDFFPSALLIKLDDFI